MSKNRDGYGACLKVSCICISNAQQNSSIVLVMPLKFELPSFEFNAQFEQLFMQSDQILMFHFDIDIGGSIPN
jgi:hypothetical protein